MSTAPASDGSAAPRKEKRSEKLRPWLAGEAKRWSFVLLGGATGLFLAAAIATYLTYNIIWFVLVFLGVSLKGSTAEWIAAAMTLALFPINAFTNHSRLENLQFERNPNLRLAYRIAPVFDAGWIGLANQQNFESFVKLLSLLILSGPQLAMGGWRCLTTSVRLRSMDPAGPARVLSHLLTQDRKFTLDELSEKLSRLDPAADILPLTDLDGVLFRTSPPAGLSLESDLRDRLTRYLQGESS